MNNYYEPKTLKEVKYYISNRFESISQRRDILKNHLAIAENSPSGKENYLRGLLDNLLEDANRDAEYITGVFLRQWLENKMPIYKDACEELTKYLYKYLQSEDKSYEVFRANVENFLLIYLQWVKITALLDSKTKRDDSKLKSIINEKYQRSFFSDLKELEREMSIQNEKACKASDFSAICFFILNRKSDAHYGSKYIVESVSFDNFQTVLSSYYSRKPTGYRLNKSREHLEKLNPKKRELLEKLFI